MNPTYDFENQVAVNLRGVWASMKHELRHMREQGSGAIVNCSSLGGLVGLPERAAYHASKIAEIVKQQPIGRLGRAEEVAAAVLWLCSPAASLVVGVALPVDGGFTAH
jgi:NAD(P)-dependent dehydrogenase (short-subunit alcohol dehydrogenase family)